MEHEQHDTPIDWAGRTDEVAEQVRAEVPEADRTGKIPRGAFKLARETGLTMALVPVEAGGPGASHAEMGAILRRLARTDPATSLTLSMHSHLVAAQVWRHHHGMDASAVFGKVLGGAFLVSTGASDWVSSTGSATKVDGGWVVSGRKSPASGCEVGDVLVTSIRWDDAPDGPQVLHCTIPCAAEGVHVEQTWDTLGLRATGSHTVVIEDVFVPDAAVSLIRPADRWHPLLNAVLGAAMPLIMSAYAGMADAAVEIATALALGSTEDHRLQLLGEMRNAHLAGTDAVDAMLASSDNLHFDNTDEHSAVTLARKANACESLIATVRLAVESSGGMGYTRSTDLERLFRDVHGCMFHPLPRAKQVRFTGRVSLGLDPIG